MRSLLILFLLIGGSAQGQDTLNPTFNRWTQSLRITGHSARTPLDNAGFYGGTEGNYQLSYAINSRTRFFLKTGYFYHSAHSNMNLPTLRYRYVPIYLGVQKQLFKKSDKWFFEFSMGITTFTNQDSKTIDLGYWSNYENATDNGKYMRRSTIIEQMHIGYTFYRQFSILVGQTMYIAIMKPKSESNLFLSLGGTLSLNYSF